MTSSPEREVPGPSDGFYQELRLLARTALQGERAGHTLQPTALAHEAWLRLPREAARYDEPHFRFAAARALRQVLIDHARIRSARKRGGGRPEPLPDDAMAPERDEYLLALDEALGDLAQRDAELARIVELRFFAGYSVEETAALIGVSPRGVVRGWRVAKGWLHRRIQAGEQTS